MCKDMNETIKSKRRLVAMAALSKLDDQATGVSQIRKTFEVVREQHVKNTNELDEAERLLEQVEDQIMDEAMAIAALEGEDQDEDCDCDCGCRDEIEGAEGNPAASYADEEEERDYPRSAPAGEAPAARGARKRTGIAPLVFGALGVACAVASLVARSLADERKE